MIYQYLCPFCQHVTEKDCPLGEAMETATCKNEDCKKVARKIVSTPGILVRHPTHPARKGRGQG